MSATKKCICCNSTNDVSGRMHVQDREEKTGKDWDGYWDADTVTVYRESSFTCSGCNKENKDSHIIGYK